MSGSGQLSIVIGGVMAAHVAGAHSWASQVSEEEFRLEELDLHVLAAHPGVLQALGRRPRRGPSAETVALAPAVAAAAGFLVLTPTWSRQDPGRPWLDPIDFGERAPLLAGWLVVGALSGLAIVAAQWWRRGRTRADLEVVGASLVLGFALAALLLLGDARGGLPGAVVGVGAAAGLGAVLSFVCLSTGKRVGDSGNFVVTGAADLSKAESLIAALPPRKVNGMLSERTRALTRLRERGLVTADEVARVQQLPLGRSVTVER